jgi:hypothetical protein
MSAVPKPFKDGTAVEDSTMPDDATRALEDAVDTFGEARRGQKRTVDGTVEGTVDGTVDAPQSEAHAYNNSYTELFNKASANCVDEFDHDAEFARVQATVSATSNEHIYYLFLQKWHDLSMVVTEIMRTKPWKMYVVRGLVEFGHLYFLNGLVLPSQLGGDFVRIDAKGIVGTVERVMIAAMQLLFHTSRRHSPRELCEGVSGKDFAVIIARGSKLRANGDRYEGAYGHVKFIMNGRIVQAVVTNKECAIFVED